MNQTSNLMSDIQLKMGNLVGDKILISIIMKRSVQVKAFSIPKALL